MDAARSSSSAPTAGAAVRAAADAAPAPPRRGVPASGRVSLADKGKAICVDAVEVKDVAPAFGVDKIIDRAITEQAFRGSTRPHPMDDVDARVSSTPPSEKRRRKSNKGTAAAEPAATIHEVPDDALRLILLRLDSPLWLVRAAATCKRWRGAVVAGGRAFLRLARSLHPPAVAGHYHRRQSGPAAFVPAPPPAPPIDARRFSLDDILPMDTSGWDVADCHGGLVLLVERVRPLRHLLVCNPLTRRYRRVSYPRDQRRPGCSVADAFLLDGSDGDIGLSSFRVLCRFKAGPGPRACVFFSTPDGGSGVRILPAPASDLDGDREGHVAGRIDGSLCLGLTTGSVIVLDNATLEFSRIPLPSLVDPSKEDYSASFGVVHGAGAPPTTRIVHANGEELEVFRRVHGGGGGEWVLEHSVRRLSEVALGMPSYLAERPFYWAVKIIAAGGVGVAVLSVELDVYFGFKKRTWLFTVDVETLAVQFAPESTYHLYRGTTATSAYALPYT